MRFWLLILVLPAAIVLPFEIKTFPSESVLVLNGSSVDPAETKEGVKSYSIDPDGELLLLRAPGYRDLYLNPERIVAGVTEFKLERMDTDFIFQNLVNAGRQPKSVRFSPDGRFLVSALLDGEGIFVFNLETFGRVEGVSLPEEYAQKKGFVETLFLRNQGELWVSQMTTGMIHVFDSESFSYLLSFPSKGSWSKVIASDPEEKRLFVSNWESNTISVIDPVLHRVVKIIRVPGIPRGMAVTPDGVFLYAAIYSSGQVVKISLDNYRIVKTIHLGSGAPRHLVIAPKSGYLYVSDMYYGKVFTVSLADDQVIKSCYFGSNLNTIVLSGDEKYLFVSSRGRNSKDGYLEKGPEFGKIFVYDTVEGRIVDWAWGGNQPTGLDVSPDGSTVAFTDFLDGKIEIYSWER